MKLTSLIEQIYKNKRDVNAQLAKQVTLPNSLQFLSLCADFFQRKQKDTSATIAVKQACRRLTDDALRLVKDYYTFIDDLETKGLAKDQSTYYKIDLTTEFDQIIYKPKENQDFVRYKFDNILVVLISLNKVLNNLNIDSVISDNEQYLTLAHGLAVLITKTKAEIGKLDAKRL